MSFNKVKSPIIQVSPYLIVYATLISLPLFCTAALCFFGYRSSGIMDSSFSIYNSEVLNILKYSIVSLVLGGGILYHFIFKYCTGQNFSVQKIRETNKAEVIVIGLIFSVSYYGLIFSFPSSILDANYNGANKTFLGIGAWSVICLFSLQFLLTMFFKISEYPYFRLFVCVVIFIPVLYYGSRIDFVSLLMAELIGYSFISSSKVKAKLLYFCTNIITVVFVCIIIRGVRYQHDYESNMVRQVFEQQVQYAADQYDEKVIYLSTIGDIGTSVYQAVDARNQTKIGKESNLANVFSNYTYRLLPGGIFNDRPIDIYITNGLILGNGALHSSGEGYLYFGNVGTILVSLILGAFAAISYRCKELYLINRDPLLWLVFIAPSLLIVRGGWYQFFSIFKGIELLLLMVFILWLIRTITLKNSLLELSHSK